MRNHNAFVILSTEPAVYFIDNLLDINRLPELDKDDQIFQSTGCLDSQGKMIYEYDIVKTRGDDYTDSGEFTVRFDNDIYAWSLRQNDMDDRSIMLTDFEDLIIVTHGWLNKEKNNDTSYA